MRTLVVIPSRYEPERLAKLVRSIDRDVLVLDNGHDELPDLGKRTTVVDARGDGIYRMWNRGVVWAREHGYDNVAILNDDVRLGRETLARLEQELRADDECAITYPAHDGHGPFRMTGFCFVFKAELPLPPFDESFEWWYGDTAFERAALQAGYKVTGVPAKVQHESDSERNDWARRPELKAAAERDADRWQSMVLRAVILVPRRANPERDKLWDWCRARWEQHFPDLPIYEGYHEQGPFNRSAAINRAARLADDNGRWDIAIVIDGDIFIRASQLRAAIRTAARTGKVTWAHRRWRGLHEDWTERVLKGQKDFGAEIDTDDMDLYVERTNPISWSCCVVIPRGVFDAIGGFDERFRGWGFEDMMFRSVVCGLYGHERIEGDVYHLYHSRVFGTGRADKRRGEYTPEAITNARLGRRAMVAVLRDYGIGDQLGQERLSKEEAAVHIRNLMADDAKLAPAAKVAKLPDWTDWWPTLEELRDGWKAEREQLREGSITLVVHTGGSAEAWPTRRDYLRRSLESLTKNVSGPFIQRVVYRDWDPEFHAELEAIAREFGFYVVGPDKNVGYTDSMRLMWRYLSKNAKGEFIFATEDDFTYPQPVELGPLIETLRDEPHLAQIALLRDAFYQDEKETGGVLGWPEPAFTKVGNNGNARLEHRLFWTANPSLFRKAITDKPWPLGHHSETQFGKQLMRDPRVRFAFWGDHVELAKHIGETRAGSGY